MVEEDIFAGLGVEVILPVSDENARNFQDRYKDAFLKIRETLTRIGIANKKEKTLYQTCHIFQKRGRYRILHFKEMFLFDGRPGDNPYNDEDRLRRNKIVSLLEEWKLLQVKDPETIKDRAEFTQLMILHHSEKDNWTLVPKYKIGKKRRG